MTWYHENWKLKRFIMIKDNKMIIVNQKNWKMTKIKGENEEHWTKKKSKFRALRTSSRAKKEQV